MAQKASEREMGDRWESGDLYEPYMGRWSSLVADRFLDWLSPPRGLRWLDVGCGSGALGAAIIKYGPAELTAVDQSKGFVEIARKRLGSKARYRIANALALPLEDSSVDYAVSGLMLNFLSEPEKALAEMRRVTISAGSIAVYVWDYADKMEFLKHFWDAALELNSSVSELHESKRFPNCTAEGLRESFEKAGFSETATIPIEIGTHFRDFNDFWQPFLGGQGPAPTYVMSLNESERNNLRELLYERLPIQQNGSIQMVARAWAARSQI